MRKGRGRGIKNKRKGFLFVGVVLLLLALGLKIAVEEGLLLLLLKGLTLSSILQGILLSSGRQGFSKHAKKTSFVTRGAEEKKFVLSGPMTNYVSGASALATSGDKGTFFCISKKFFSPKKEAK